MPNDITISPSRVGPAFVLAKCDYFVDVHLWPRPTRLDPVRWLTNFTTGEQDHAVHLLNAFQYYSSELVTEMLKAAFQRLSSLVLSVERPYVSSLAGWHQFRRRLIVTHVTGAAPSDTGSGYLFSRLARQELDLREDRIMAPDRALDLLLREGPLPVLFVDDFVGTGDQFVKTWRRPTTLADGTVTSFERCAVVRGSSFFYCPILCSWLGQEAIARDCSCVTISPAHFLSRGYSALSPESFVWPDHLRPTAVDFLRTASERAGIYNWEGYGQLGLTVAFEHGVPDATLPLFYHDANGWRPLVPRK